MHRLLCFAAILALLAAGCGDNPATAPEQAAATVTEQAASAGPADHGKGRTAARLSEVDNRETHTDIFAGFRVVIFWQFVNGTWLWRVEIYRTDDGSYLQGSGWDAYGPTRSDVDTRVRTTFDHNGNNFPDGGEAGAVDNQG